MLSVSSVQKQKYFERGHTLPKCVNPGCNNDVAVRNWSNWSFKSECGRCQTDRKKGYISEGVEIHKKKYCENINVFSHPYYMISSVFSLHPDFIDQLLQLNTSIEKDIELIIKLDKYTKEGAKNYQEEIIEEYVEEEEELL
jgi:hypothetical protein